MICRACGAAIAEDSAFCNKCGVKLIPETVVSLDGRLTKVEGQLSSDSHTRLLQQNFLELETAEWVMTRVRTWTTLILYFAGIPAAIALLALTVMFGKGAFDLHSVAANARSSIESLLQQAHSTASEAEKAANDALAKSKQTDAYIQRTQSDVSKLKAQVDARVAEVQHLGDSIKGSQAQVDSLKLTVASQSKEVQRLTEQVHQAQTTKSIEDIVNLYPQFGEHRARGVSGWIDPKQKTANAIYIDLNLSFAATPNLEKEKIAQAVTELNHHNYTVFLGQVYTYATGTNSIQSIGMGFDPNTVSAKRTPSRERFVWPSDVGP